MYFLTVVTWTKFGVFLLFIFHFEVLTVEVSFIDAFYFFVQCGAVGHQ